MDTNSLHKYTGWLLVGVATSVILSQLGLMVFFDFPDVMREPTATLLDRYQAGGPLVRLSWFLFACACLMLVPIANLLQEVLKPHDSPMLRIGTALGMVCGFSYVLGIMRWVLVTDFLATQYLDPGASACTRESLLLIFRAFDVYCGNSFGETVAPLAHGVWAAALGGAMMRSAVFPRWMAWAQMGCAVFIAARPAEYVGLTTVGEASDGATLAWTILCVLMGVHLLRGSAR